MIYFAAIVGMLLGLKRRCPRCGRDQIVPRGKKHKTVKMQILLCRDTIEEEDQKRR
jgi:hypothetical protein